MERTNEGAAPPWADLYWTLQRAGDPFAAADADWQPTWQAMSGDPWFVDQLGRRAQVVLHMQHETLDWQADVEHEALLILANRLQRRPDFGMGSKVSEDFPNWFGAVVYYVCWHAVRRVRRLYRSNTLTTEELDQFPAPEDVLLEWRIDISMLVESRDDLSRSILALYQKGHTAREIAARLDVSYQKTCRIIRRGVKELRVALVDYAARQ